MTKSRILIVDDDPQIRRLVVRLLASDDVLMMSAESTQEAERLLAEGPVDLLLCDHLMPEENGLPFLQRCKTQYPSMARVLVTGCGDSLVGMDAINKAQVRRCLTKPFEGAELRTIVGELLAERRESVARSLQFTRPHRGTPQLQTVGSPSATEARRTATRTFHPEDSFGVLSKALDDWAQFADEQDIKNHEDVLSQPFIKLSGS